MGEALPKFDVKQMMKTKKQQPSLVEPNKPEETKVVDLPKQKAEKKTTPKNPKAKKPRKKPANKKTETKLKVVKQNKAQFAGQFNAPEVTRQKCREIAKLIQVKFESSGSNISEMTPQAIQLNKFFDYFNHVLFNNELPPCMVRFEKERTALGMYHPVGSDIYWHRKVKGKKEYQEIPDITLNHRTHRGLALIETLATLVHEMAHHWEHTIFTEVSGKEIKGGYHTANWAQKMESVGLVPSATALPGGKKTGRKCSHYIKGHKDDDSPKVGDQGFLQAFKYMPKTWVLPWNVDVALNLKPKKKPTNKNKVKYICPEWDKETNDCLGHFWMKGDVDPELVWTCSVHNVKAEPEQKG